MGERGVRDLLNDAYFKGAHGILAVCDVTRAETLANLATWRQSVENAAGKVPAFVLANKVDLDGEAVLTSAHVEATDELRDCPSVMTSAKTGNGVEAAFQGLANLILESRLTEGTRIPDSKGT